MNLFQKINMNYFLISFCIGIFVCYITKPIPKIIFKYPTPNNVKDTIFTDKHENCYKYESETVECPIDKNKIKSETSMF